MSALLKISIKYPVLSIKGLLIFIFLFFSLLLTTYYLLPTAHAQESTNSASPLRTTNYELPTTVSPASPVYTDLLVYNMFHTFSCLAVGQSVIGQPCLTYQVQKNAQGAVQNVPVLSQTDLSGGALGATTSLIGALYANPPVRTVDYLASVGEGLGFVKEAHAQGVVGSGANVLSPILSLWQVSRNISYVIMIIIFVVIGLMIMFRQRINPQTVITAQAALPGLVIGLIMITFSYFLAGLISDMAFIGTNLVGGYFTAVKGDDTPENLVQSLSDRNVIGVFGRFTGIINKDNAADALSAVWDELSGFPQFVLTALAVFITTNITTQSTSFFQIWPGIGQGIQAAITGIVGAVTAANPTAMIGMALAFVATIILIYTMLKLLLRLINAYLTIIFLTISAPFQFLFSALPGRQGMATSWIRGMLANVLAFPAVIAVLYFVAFLLGRSLDPATAAATSAPEQLRVVGGATFPLLGGLDLSFINLLLAFGALVALPKIPDLIARAVGGVSEAGQLIGQEIGAGIGAGRGYAGQFQAGIGGFSRGIAQVGPVTDQPGYIYQGGQWVRVTGATPGLTEQQAYISGYRPGARTRFTAGLRGLFRRGPVEQEPPVNNR